MPPTARRARHAAPDSRITDRLKLGQLTPEAYSVAIQAIARARVEAAERDARRSLAAARRGRELPPTTDEARIAGMVDLLVALGVPETTVIEDVDEHFLSLREL